MAVSLVAAVEREDFGVKNTLTRSLFTGPAPGEVCVLVEVVTRPPLTAAVQLVLTAEWLLNLAASEAKDIRFKWWADE